MGYIENDIYYSGKENSPRPISVKTLDNYLLEIEFKNGEIKIFDVKPYLDKPPFRKLKDVSMFNTVKITEDGSTIGWINELDICPDTIYEDSYIR